jgi:HEXXH motif-containing protein
MNLADLDVAEGLSQIRAHRVHPGVFGRYYDVVFALQSQRHDQAGSLFREIIELAFEWPVLAVLPFSADALGADTERYSRLLSLESESSVDLTAPQVSEWSEFERGVAAALALIEEADADLASELRAVVIQIVGAVPAARNGRGFGGASSFMLWGAVLLNARLYAARLDMVAALIHEAAHQLLFGQSLDDPLLENPIDERYGSPLRTDPRPMNGIFHATFVCARMHYAYVRLVEGAKTALSQADRELVEQRLREYRSKFRDGVETVRRFGRMTPLGDRILGAATDYMRSAS